ncbi:MAG: ARMT1-like domain-containing protein [Nitrospirota bacterium]|nr:ARMT1-like domain-containing protein [Nitrospirota bacterium]
MRTELECLPCFFRQVSRTLSYAAVDPDLGKSISREASRIVETASLDQAPARISTLLHRLMRERTGMDPYREVKETYNGIALELLPVVRMRASGAGEGGDRLAGAVRAAIAGNIIDFGIYETIDLERSLRDSFELPLATTDYDLFARAVDRAERILYLCDNAGEIVFDRVLIEELRGRGKEVTAVVKGTPVINDATMDDARATGLADSAGRVIDNGNDGIGTLLEQCSPEFLEAYHDADLIVSKGQANFETLVPEQDERTFYLFKVKCPVVAAALGRPDGDIVLSACQSASACLRN